MPDVMYPNYKPTDPDAQVFLQDDGRIRVGIYDDSANETARCWILSRHIAIGKARTGMGGISYVSTNEEHRNKGLGRRLMLETNRFCQSVGMGIIMLYGIPDYYPKFGYAVCGPEYRVELHNPDVHAKLPEGWSSRESDMEDLPAIRAIYQHWLEKGCCGAHDRHSAYDPAWQSLEYDCIRHNIDECQVVCSPQGHVEGYAWHCRTNNFVQGAEQQEPETLVWGEVMALNPSAADAVVAVCQQLMPVIGLLTDRNLSKITFSLPPHGEIANALRWGHCRFRHDFQKDAWFMSRCADVSQLLQDMLPEFESQCRHHGVLEARLVIGVDGIMHQLTALQGILSHEKCIGKKPDLELSSGQLSQLVLGTYTVDEFYSRQIVNVNPEVIPICKVLFPKRYNHVFLRDRF